MPFDLATAAVSTVIATAVTYLVAPAKSAREERGRQVLEARRELKVAVEPLLANVTDYRAGIDASVQRVPRQHFGDDLLFAEAVLFCADRLPWWRKVLVRRRLRRLVGTMIFDLADTGPVRDRDSSESFDRMIRWGLEHRDGDKYETDEAIGMLDTALEQPHASPDVERLRKQLVRLSRAW